MITIPSNDARKWRVAHGRDLAADIVDSRHMNFDKEGYARMLGLPVVLYTTTDSANFGLPLSIFSDGDNYYTVTSAGMWYTATGSVFAQATTGTPPSFGLHSDGVMFNGEAVASGSTTVCSFASGTWTSRITGNSASYPHPLCVFENRNELAVANGNVVKTYNTSYSVQNTLTIPAEYTVVWMVWRQFKLYIGTRNVSGSGAKMFVWNGTGSSAQEAYGVQADWMYSGTEYQSSIAVVTSAGQILRFNGGGFDELEHFPVYETQYSWTSSAAPASAVGKVSSRGMSAHGDLLYINIDGSLHRNGVDYPGNFLHTQPSGLWAYSPKVGLYHKAGYRYSKYASLTPTSVASDVLQFAVDHYAQTGDAIMCTTVDTLTGVVANQIYYAIKISESSLSLAYSPSDAFNERAVTLGGSAGSSVFALNTYQSLGAVNDVTPGAVSRFTNVSFYDFYGTEVMWGGRAQNQAGTVVSSLMSFGLGRNQASLTTAPIYTRNITEIFQKFYEKIKQLRLDSDKLIVKWRTTDRFGVPTPTYANVAGKATWVDSTSFTIDSTYKDIKSILDDDEVAIISGVGAGRTAHITEIEISGSTYTITIDEAIPYVLPGYLSDVIIDNWTRLHEVNNETESLSQGYAGGSDAKTASWIQYKIEYRGKDVSVNMLQLITNAGKQPE